MEIGCSPKMTFLWLGYDLMVPSDGLSVLKTLMEGVVSSAEKDGLIFSTQRSKKATGQYKNKT